MNSFLALNKQLCFAVYEVSSQMTKLYSSVLQPFQLTYPQYLVLLALWEEDGVTVKQLGDILGIGTGTLTPMLNRMEAQQWLRKNVANKMNGVFIFILNIKHMNNSNKFLMP